MCINYITGNLFYRFGTGKGWERSTWEEKISEQPKPKNNKKIEMIIVEHRGNGTQLRNRKSIGI